MEDIGHDDRERSPEQAARFMANDRRRRRPFVSYEEAIDTAEGTLTFLATKGPLHDDSGAVAAVFGISRDITQRQRAEQALRESEATTRAILAAMGDGMFIAQDRRFVFANPALPALLGYTHDEFVGLPFEKVIAPEHLELWTERFEQRVGEGIEPRAQYEVQMLRRDGGDPVWVNCVPIGSPTGSKFRHGARHDRTPAVHVVLRRFRTLRRWLAARWRVKRHRAVNLARARGRQRRRIMTASAGLGVDHRSVACRRKARRGPRAAEGIAAARRSPVAVHGSAPLMDRWFGWRDRRAVARSWCRHHHATYDRCE
jgi:PAS domain S-box-containing protein